MTNVRELLARAMAEDANKEEDYSTRWSMSYVDGVSLSFSSADEDVVSTVSAFNNACKRLGKNTLERRSTLLAILDTLGIPYTMTSIKPSEYAGKGAAWQSS